MKENFMIINMKERENYMIIKVDIILEILLMAFILEKVNNMIKIII